MFWAWGAQRSAAYAKLALSRERAFLVYAEAEPAREISDE